MQDEGIRLWNPARSHILSNSSQMSSLNTFFRFDLSDDSDDMMLEFFSLSGPNLCTMYT